jgi:hypothetical protein
MRTLFLTIAACTISACATPTYNYAPTTDVFSAPPLNERTTVAVGDRMLAQGQTIEREALKLSQVVKVGGYTLTPGVFPKTGSNDGSQYYSFSFVPTADGNGNQLGTLQVGLLQDPAQSIEVQEKSNKICVITVFNVHTCRTGKAFEITTYRQTGDAAFQQTLYYNGRVGDKINIGYREYSGDMARPAFSNEVEYDLSVSSEFSYKGAKILVHEANNNQIIYTVLQNFRGYD